MEGLGAYGSDDDSDDDVNVAASAPYPPTGPPAGPGPVAHGAEDYPNTDDAYPNTDDAYPNTDDAYPNTDDAYPNTDDAYPNTDDAYPNTDDAYPNTDAQYGAAMPPEAEVSYGATMPPRQMTDAEYEAMDAEEGDDDPYPDTGAQYGAAMAPTEPEEEIVVFEPPNWSKLPSGHPEVRLDVFRDDRKLGTLPLGDEKFLLVGRSEEHANMIVNDASVSPVHAAIINSGSKTFVQDLGSKHGTYVDDTRIKANAPMELKEGAGIRFGDSEPLYRIIGIQYDKKKAVTSNEWAPPEWATDPEVIDWNNRDPNPNPDPNSKSNPTTLV